MGTEPSQLEVSLNQYLYSSEYTVYLSNYKNSYRDIIFIPQLFPQLLDLNAQMISVEKGTVFDLEIEKLTKTYDVTNFNYESDNAFLFELKSPDEKYIAKEDGVYAVATNELIADVSPISTSPSANSGCGLFIPWCLTLYEPCCWQADNQAVFYSFSSENSRVTPYSIGAPWGFNGEVVTPIFRVHLPSSTP